MKTGDGDENFDLYPSDLLDDACVSNGVASHFSTLAEDQPSPALSEEDISPSFQFHQHSLSWTQDDLSVPEDFELRQSSATDEGLGVWTHRKVEVDERFGPYDGERTACLLDRRHGWEVRHFKLVYFA
uniref:Uncharacterized protein n=1 Tax=Knipowitschia caucasica TaxID=637954 RepID=A0AAV2J9H9_KNICA